MRNVFRLLPLGVALRSGGAAEDLDPPSLLQPELPYPLGLLRAVR